MLNEDDREREYFDRNTAELYGGDPLAQVQHTLATMSRTAPQAGSFPGFWQSVQTKLRRQGQRLTPEITSRRLAGLVD